MKFIHALLFSAWCCLLSISQASDLSHPRTWHSDDGRAIEARVLEISAEARTVKMQRTDGFRFTLDWERLAESDRALLQASVAKQDRADEETAAVERQVAERPSVELPEDFMLEDVPMVTQKENYCVPASATMIAGYHGIETDQDQVAELSSEMSASNQGTYPSDMLLAMQKLGFKGHSLHWKNEDQFMQTVLPQIRRTLVETGPIYISFKPDVFGSMGHGCVIIGYDDRKEELSFHNPWGNEFQSRYKYVAVDGYGVVFIQAPEPAPVATDAFIEQIKKVVPRFEGDFLELNARLDRAAQAHRLVWCSRRDARADKRFARDTARDDGRMILELAFERNPAVLIPSSKDGETEKYLFVTRPPEGGARFLVRAIDKQGWAEPELVTLGRLTRNWTTAFTEPGSNEKIWELPMIELQPAPSL